MIEHRTLEEYKEELKSLTKDECYEWMYQMSEQLCKIDEIIKYSKGMDFQKLEEIKKLLNPENDL